MKGRAMGGPRRILFTRRALDRGLTGRGFHIGNESKMFWSKTEDLQDLGKIFDPLITKDSFLQN